MASLSRGETVVQCGKYWVVVKGKDKIIQKVIDLQKAGANASLVQRDGGWYVVNPPHPLLSKVAKRYKVKDEKEKKRMEAKHKAAKAANKKRKKKGRTGEGLR